MKRKSFTLIELITSISIFVILVMAALDLFSSVTTKHQAAVETQKVSDNLRYVMEVMSRDIEEGRVIALLDSEGGSPTTLAINHQTKGSCGSISDCLQYHFVSSNQTINEKYRGRIQIRTNEDPAACQFVTLANPNPSETDTCPFLTSSEVLIENFDINVDATPGVSTDQPKVTISIKAKARKEKTGISGVTQQITVNQKELGNEYRGKVVVFEKYVGTDSNNDCLIGASNEDVFVKDSTINSNDSIFNDTSYLYTTRSTEPGETKFYHIGIRFDNVDIPQNVSIQKAYLYVKASCDLTGTGCSVSGEVKSILKGELPTDGDADSFTTGADGFSDFMTRYRTPDEKNKDWTITDNWEENDIKVSVDISDIIREITSATNWTAGNALVIFWEIKSDSTIGTYREVFSYDKWQENCTDYAPKLYVEYYVSQ